MNPSHILTKFADIHATSLTFQMRLTLKNKSKCQETSQDNRRSKTCARIKAKKLRLLLLQHASSCSNTDGKCELTKYCTEMKCLWYHINKCYDPECKVKHCLSSKKLMMHYEQCMDINCEVCSPVRKNFARLQRKKQKYKGTCLECIVE